MEAPLLGDAFCGELPGSARSLSNEFTATYQGSPPSRILHQSDNFSFLVDLSPIVRGHTLIVPHEHELNMAAAVIGFEKEFSRFVRHCAERYREAYGPATIIEHGSSQVDVAAGSCITHAHWHFLPKIAGLPRTFAADRLPKICDVDFADYLLPTSAAGGPYILFADEHGAAIYEATDLPLPQYARSLVGRLAGMSPAEWDWAVVVRKQTFWDTYRDLGGSE